MNKITIAKITSAHGIKGYVKILSFADNSTDFIKYSGRIFDKNDNIYQLKIISHLSGKSDNLFIVKISGVESRNSADLLRNTELYIKREDLEDISEDEFYCADLANLKVLDKKMTEIGKVVAVEDFGAGSLIEIEFADNKKQFFSFTNEIFPEINIKKGFLILEIPEEIEIKQNEN